MRTVPENIGKPPYALTGVPPRNDESRVKTPEVIERMRVAGAAAAEILRRAGEMVRPGITTDEIDIFVHNLTIEMGGYPSPLNYHNYPKSVCTSVNEVICHGIPDSRVLEDGDIIDIDANAGTMSVRLSDEELAARRAAWAPRRHDFQSGAIWRYAQTVSPARYGAVVHPGGAAETHNYFES